MENLLSNNNSCRNSYHLSLEIDKVLLILSKFAVSSAAKNKIKTLEPFENPQQIKYALKLTDIAKKIIEDTSLNPPLEEIADVEKILKNRNLTTEELIDLAKNLKMARKCKNFLYSKDYPEINNIVSNLYINKTLEDEVFETFDSNLEVKDSASDTLKSLRISYKDNKENLKSAIENLLRSPSFVENLQDTVVTTRDERPVFQVKASCKNKVQGIVHDISSTNLTYFIEPGVLVPLSNKLKQIEIQINSEIARILAVLSTKFIQISKELFKNRSILIELDILFAKAKYAIKTKSETAQITDEKIIDIQKMAHPLLLETKDDSEIVRNDFALGINYKCLLITGSNTGGKTVALKTAGLMVLMTKFGLAIPAQGAKIYPFKEIYCDISETQDLEKGFSTFSASIKNIINILEKIDSDSLILFDEFGSGTDPNEGAKLSRAIFEYIKEKGALCCATAHLGELKQLKYTDSYFENATVLFDIETLKPKYNLIIGLSGSSNAIDISSQLGLNSKIVERARQLLHEGSKPDKMLTEIENLNYSILKKEQTAKDTLKEADSVKNELTEKLEDFKKNKKKSLQNFKKKFQLELDNARGEIRNIVDEIRKEKSLKVAMRQYDKLNKIENKIREQFSSTDNELSEKYPPLDPDNLKIGQNVLIKKLNQVVILESLPDKKDMVQVRIGNITSNVKLQDLAKTDKKVALHLKKVKVNFDNTTELLTTIDLRGMRVYDAIDYLDKCLDKASLKGLGQVKIIHGHGTGALRAAVGDYLKNSPYVSKFYYDENQDNTKGSMTVELN